MKNKKLRKLNKRNLITKIVFAISVFVVTFAIVLLSSDYFYVKAEPSYVTNTESYSSDLAHITNANALSDSSTITMTAANAAGSNNSKTITIANKAELFLFSTRCNSTDAFLGYSYKLINNIDLTEDNDYFTPVGWKSGKPFS